MITKDEILDKYNIPEEKRESAKKMVKKEKTAFLKKYAQTEGLKIPAKCSREMLEIICLDHALESQQKFQQKLIKRLETKDRHEQRFQQIFGVSINRFYGHPYLGFDVISFDQNIAKPQDGESTIHCLKRRFGPEAENMIQELIC